MQREMLMLVGQRYAGLAVIETIQQGRIADPGDQDR
jgi:hypothetical protein